MVQLTLRDDIFSVEVLPSSFIKDDGKKSGSSSCETKNGKTLYFRFAKTKIVSELKNGLFTRL